jgi:hypothetical protein
MPGANRLEGAVVRLRTGFITIVTVVLAATIGFGCTSGPSNRSASKGATATTQHQEAVTPVPKGTPQQLRAQFEQFLGAHTMLAVRFMRSVVTGPPELRQALLASLKDNTQELKGAVAAAYGQSEGSRFEQLWQRHIDALAAYANGVATRDAAARQTARTNLVAYCSAHGSWFAQATRGRVPASVAASGVRQHVDELMRQLDLYAAHDYAQAYRIQRMAYEHMFTAGATMAKASITPEQAVGFDAPPQKLRSAFDMLLGEHMELIIDAQRATFAGAQEFNAAAAQVNANTTALTQAMGAILGPRKGAEFQSAWANHIDGLMAYTTAVVSKDEAGKQAAERNLDAFANRLALYFSGVVNAQLPVEPVTAAITMHDGHLINQVNAYAAKDYTKAQEMEDHGYHQMLGVANTLVGAIQRTVKMPAGGSQTGGGGTAQRRR